MGDLGAALAKLAVFDWLRWILFAAILGSGIVAIVRTIGRSASVTTQVVRWLFGTMLVGLMAVIALPTGSPGQWIVLFILSVGLLAIGIVVGFLFGLPKSLEPEGSSTGAAPLPTSARSSFVRYLQTNNNLQKVSDWLTTVITGLTLTQLLNIPGYVVAFGTFIQSSLHGLNDAVAVGAGMLLYFPSAGFASGYLITRLVLTTEFDRTERELVSGDARTVSEATSADFKLFGVLETEPTTEQREAAARILQMPLSSLTTADEKAAWARAQSLQGNWDNAIMAFQQAIVLDPDDVGLLEDYANALYMAKKSPLDVISALDRALSAATDDPYARARIMANKSQAYLDMGDYQHALENIEQLLADPALPKRARYYMYRAQANGRKWAQLHRRNSQDPALSALATSIVDDTKLAINLDPALRAVFQGIAAPASGQTPAGELSAFAESNADFRAAIA